MLVAGAANLLIAVAKLFAGLASGSSAMLAEAAHSVGDTINQAFLLTALRRSQRPPDPEHPFGYGMARYFWALLAAVGIFVLGAGFAAYEGITALLHPEETGSPMWSFVVLGAAFCFEGASFVRAVWQLRQRGRGSRPARGHAPADRGRAGLAGRGVGGRRRPGRSAAGRGRPGPRRAHRHPGLGRRGLAGHRGAAGRGGLRPGAAEHGAPDRQGRRARHAARHRRPDPRHRRRRRRLSSC